MKSTDYCTITNRSPGVVAYYLSDSGKLREFYPKETKRVLYSEIEEVSAQPGGRELLYNYFYIQEAGAIEKALNVKPEPEYYLTEAQIDGWMVSSTLDQFKDALDFAPEGVKDLIKVHAVSLPLNDISKCNAIKTQLGFDVLTAIKNEQATQTDDDGVQVHASKRRAEPSVSIPEKSITPARRTTASKYNVVKREGN